MVGSCAASKEDQGILEGNQRSGVFRFRGIPFAAPPVGERRWAAPQPPAAWDGVRDATQFGKAAIQTVDTGVDLGAQPSEDCLYLNVWTASPGPAGPSTRNGLDSRRWLFEPGGVHAGMARRQHRPPRGPWCRSTTGSAHSASSRIAAVQTSDQRGVVPCGAPALLRRARDTSTGVVRPRPAQPPFGLLRRLVEVFSPGVHHVVGVAVHTVICDLPSETFNFSRAPPN
jgi:Carboxylesterase family